jgi:DNA repair photolyase
VSRMFKTVSRTWNVFKGCRFECTYCNARKIAETRLKYSPRYRDGFTPRLVTEELSRHFRPGEFIFVGYMGDISFATRDEVGFILAQTIEFFCETSFLFCSKNPAVYFSWELAYPNNLYLGTTIETNRDYGLSKAPPPLERFHVMAELRHVRKFVSMEPVMDFDLEVMARWLKEIKPDIVEIGADNYHNHLPEPSWWKVEALVGALRQVVPQVVEKDGLERLKGGNH